MDHANPLLRWIVLLPLLAAVGSGIWLMLVRRAWPRNLVVLVRSSRSSS
jgi:hypothetical protein